jgi:quaternary ammonium compound-resistance protein SugE
VSIPGGAWIVLLIAGLFEVIWALGLKYSDGFTRLWPSVITAVAAAISFWLLAQALRDIPIGTAYAVWVGIGAAGTAILGVFLFGDQLSLLKVAGIMLILLGVLALRLSETA